MNHVHLVFAFLSLSIYILIHTNDWSNLAKITKSDRFRYLGSILQENGELDGDLNHRIRVGWMKCKSASGVLCDRRRSLKLKEKFYKIGRAHV